MDNMVLSEKLRELQDINKKMRDNKDLIKVISREGYILNVKSAYGTYDLSDDQRKTVNHLIVSFLQQNVDEMEKELKPLADLLAEKEGEQA